MGSIRTHHVPLPPQEDPNPSIAVPGILRRESVHGLHGWGISHRQARLIAQRRARDREQGARAAARQATRLRERDLLPAHACAYHFFRVISWSTSSSRSRSATSFFSRLFSNSSCRRRLTSVGSRL